MPRNNVNKQTSSNNKNRATKEDDDNNFDDEYNLPDSQTKTGKYS